MKRQSCMSLALMCRMATDFDDMLVKIHDIPQLKLALNILWRLCLMASQLGSPSFL